MNSIRTEKTMGAPGPTKPAVTSGLAPKTEQGVIPQNSAPRPESLCQIWIAPDGTIHAQNLTRPLAQILSRINPGDAAMRIRAQESFQGEPPLPAAACQEIPRPAEPSPPRL